MIPLKLQLKNFLSYGPEIQIIDFSPYHLICLSGKNGHGKSALLDAMTWALWGQARKTTMSNKPDANLLHLGQTFMMVTFDFEFNGQLYRIKREFGKTYGKPYAQLEFGLLNPETNVIIPLTDKTIKKTQHKIEETLRLNFESFVNSAFLRQGSANEFSQKNPKERKEILAAILGLNHYDELRRRALEKIKLGAAAKTAHQTIIEKIQTELNTQTMLEEQKTTLQSRLKEIAQLETNAEQKRLLLEQQEQLLRADQKKYEMLQFQQQQLITNKQELQQQLRISLSEWRTIHRKKLLLPPTTVLDAQFVQLSNALKEHQQKLQRTLTLREQILKTKEEMHRLAQQLQEQYHTKLQEQKIVGERAKTELANAQRKEAELKTIIANYETELVQITKEQNLQSKLLENKETYSKQLAALELQFDKRKAFYQKMATLGNMLSSELQSLQQKELLTHNEQDPSCPLCEQNLSSSRKKFLKNKFSLSQQSIQHQLSRIKKIINTLKPLLIAQNDELKTMQKGNEQFATALIQQETLRTNLVKNTAELQKTIAHVQNIATMIQQLNNQLKATEHEVAQLEKNKTSSLETNADYHALTTQLSSFEQETKTINYQSSTHQEAERQLHTVEKLRTEAYALQQEIHGQDQRAEHVHGHCLKLKEIKTQEQAIAQELNAFAQLAAREKELNHLISEFKEQLKHVSTNKETALQEKGKIEAQQLKLTQLAQELTQEQSRLAELTKSNDDYYAIAAAAGKDGIQALLIEEAIPEIEQEANVLLAKLTNNQAQLFLESLRDLKSGGTKETLDINISDAAGIRPYELFSGGEAFRIDFALRIAISKLLARRAGTALQTLIIDEGFGSQDEEGLGFIMDALYKIQDDFAKIIIVSHLPTMKDQFPVHFVVEKKPQGSVVKVMEQG